MTRRGLGRLAGTLMALSLAVWLAAPAQAALYDPVSVPASGLLSGKTDFLGTDGWNDMTISYSITLNPDGKTVHYKYTFDDIEGIKKDFSHIILMLTQGIDGDEVFNVKLNGSTFTQYSFGNWDGSQPSNPGLPTQFYGVKFDNLTGTTVTISFDSTQLPMEGYFYAKDGVFNPPGSGKIDVYAHNIGEGYKLLPVPNEKRVFVPLPGSALLVGSGLLGLVLVGRRLRQRR